MFFRSSSCFPFSAISLVEKSDRSSFPYQILGIGRLFLLSPFIVYERFGFKFLGIPT